MRTTGAYSVILRLLNLGHNPWTITYPANTLHKHNTHAILINTMLLLLKVNAQEHLHYQITKKTQPEFILRVLYIS